MNRESTAWGSRTKLFAMTAAIAVLVLLVTPVMVAFWPRVTPDNYLRISDSMTFQETVDLLGSPDYDTTEQGLISGSGTYVTNAFLSATEKRELGYKTYRRVQWTSPTISIIVVFDRNDRVATHYRSDGHDSALWWR